MRRMIQSLRVAMLHVWIIPMVLGVMLLYLLVVCFVVCCLLQLGVPNHNLSSSHES